MRTSDFDGAQVYVVGGSLGIGLAVAEREAMSIAAESGGNPLFVVELARFAARGGAHHLLGAPLVAHRGDRLHRRADEDEPRLGARLSKRSVLREEAVARVNGVIV